MIGPVTVSFCLRGPLICSICLYNHDRLCNRFALFVQFCSGIEILILSRSIFYSIRFVCLVMQGFRVAHTVMIGPVLVAFCLRGPVIAWRCLSNCDWSCDAFVLFVDLARQWWLIAHTVMIGCVIVSFCSSGPLLVQFCLYTHDWPSNRFVLFVWPCSGFVLPRLS